MSLNVYDSSGNFQAGSYLDGMWSGPLGTNPGIEKPNFFPNMPNNGNGNLPYGVNNSSITQPPQVQPPQPPTQIAGDDAFFQSPEYKAFQEDSEKMGGFNTVVHNSPYFGQMGDSRGVLQDAAYRKYKGIAEPNPITFAGPPQTASGPGGLAGLAGNITPMPFLNPPTIAPTVPAIKPGGLANVSGITAVTKGNPMAGLFQGDPLPPITKTTEDQQSAPEFYTNYLQDIANLGQNAVQQGGVAGFSPLQQQAFQMAPDVAFAGAGSMGASSQLLGEAGATTVPDVIADYMNPYTSSVVDEMGRLTQRNVQENILPNLGAAAAGSGQFGSRRQSQITGNSLRDIQADLLGKQMQALQMGYKDAGTFAQNDLTRALQSGQAFENLGQAQQGLGLAGLKTMSDYGAQQQAQGQKLLDYPMAQSQQFAKLLQGYQMPMGRTTQTTGPEASAYSSSPLSQIAGLGTMFASLFPNTSKTDAETEYYKALTENAKKSGTTSTPLKTSTYKSGGGVRLADGGMAPTGSEYHDGNGNFYDVDGYLVE